MENTNQNNHMNQTNKAFFFFFCKMDTDTESLIGVQLFLNKVSLTIFGKCRMMVQKFRIFIPDQVSKYEITSKSDSQNSER